MNIKLNKSKKGLKFEKQVQRSIGSGRIWFSPLDLNYEDFCVEAKYTDKKGFRISLDLVEKTFKQSLNMNKEPYLIIGIKRNDKEIFTLQCRIILERREF